MQRTIAALPEDEDALLRVEAALRSAPGFVGAPPPWRLFRRPGADWTSLPEQRRTEEQH